MEGKGEKIEIEIKHQLAKNENFLNFKNREIRKSDDITYNFFTNTEPNRMIQRTSSTLPKIAALKILNNVLEVEWLCQQIS
jgi:hypothetical protein